MCVWCWDSVGKAVDLPTQHYSTYPHPIPIQHQVFPTFHKRTARQTPLSPPSTNSHPLYLPYIHRTQLHSRVNSTPTNPTDPRPHQKRFVHYPTNRHTLPPPNRPTPTPQPDPTTPPYPPHILSYPPNSYPSYPYMPTRRKDFHQS